MSESSTEYANYPTVIAKALAEIDEMRYKVLRWSETAAQLEAVVSETGLDIRPTIGYQFSSLQGFLLMIDVTDLSVLIPAFRVLRRHGWRVETHEDEPDMNCRRYTIVRVNPDDVATICPVVMRAFLPWSEEGKAAAMRKFVEVGKKEVPVYEIQCTDKGLEYAESAS